MKTTLWGLLATLACAIAQATDVTLNWAAPAQNADHSALCTGVVFTYNIYGANQGVTPLPLLTPAPISSTTNLRSNVDPGTTKCYAVSAFEQCPSQPISPESILSAPACRMIPPLLSATPAPPSGVTAVIVTTTTIAYSIVNGNDHLTFLIVGTVPLGTPCDTAQPAGPFFVIPHAAVVFSGAIKPNTTVGACAPPG